jgi:hypothetical protein
MKRVSILGAFLSLLMLYSCSGISNEIKAKSLSERNDVFQEIIAEEPIPKGFADITITAQIKTHLPGYFALKSANSLDGKAQYPFLFNIDGQAVMWNVDGKKENTPVYDSDGNRTQDGGEGMRYVLKKKIRVAACSHKIYFALPGKNYYKEVEVTARNGERLSLEFKPVYRRYRSISQDYTRGIKDYQFFQNGK